MLVALLVVLGDFQAKASTLKGVVILNEAGGAPVANVVVSAVDGANPTVTKSNGTFILEFPQKRPGEPIQLIVQKEGYVVVNDIQLEQVLPTDAAGKPLTLLLCRKGDREEMARRFYRLKSGQAIEESYSKRLKELEGMQRANAIMLEELRREREQARSAAAKTADELAKKELDTASELYREAMRLFLEGRVQEATDRLNDENLNRLVATARKKRLEAEKEEQEATYGWILKGQLLTLQFRFNEAERAYKAATEASPDSFEAHFTLGSFSEELNRNDQARAAYGRCLELARQGGSEANIAATLNNLGNLNTKQNRLEEARQAYEEALKIRRQLAQRNPDAYLPDVARTLNNLGNLDDDENRMDEARQAYDEALEIGRQLARNNPETYLPDVATTLNNLGLLDRRQNRMEAARQENQQALAAYRQLAEKNPHTYLPYVAGRLNNAGILDGDQNRMEEARKEFEEALRTYRQLAERNPETYLPYVAGTLNNLGLLDRDQNRLEEARQAFEQSLQICRRLAKEDPETYLPQVANDAEQLGTP
jgi:tetratricopeptide (TPR) repeat protein